MRLWRNPLIWPLALLFLAAVAHGQTGRRTEKPLTNQTVIQMTKIHYAEEDILSAIKSHAGDYDTSPDGLSSLKAAGVSDKILAAIIEKTKSSAATTPPPSSSKAAPEPKAETQETSAKDTQQQNASKKTSVFTRIGSAAKGAVKNSADRFTGKTVIDKVGLRNILPQYDRSRPLSEQYPHIAVTILKAPMFWGGSYKSRPSLINGDCFTLKAMVWTDVRTSKTVGPFDWCQSSDTDFKEIGPAYMETMLPPFAPDKYTGTNRTEGPVPPHTLLPNDRETIERIVANGGDNGDPNSDTNSRLAFLFANLRLQFGETLNESDFRVWIVGIR